MSAYMVITAQISDIDGFRAYSAVASKLVADFGGEYMVMAPEQNILLEGDWPDERRLVISKWPSVEAALAFWNSPEYAEAKHLRAGNSVVSVRLVSGRF
jgi:uncharacterized protein (DUF1330 family)